jgi:hypothetical protein
MARSTHQALADERNASVQIWINDEFFPRAARTGYEHGAFRFSDFLHQLVYAAHRLGVAHQAVEMEVGLQRGFQHLVFRQCLLVGQGALHGE